MKSRTTRKFWRLFDALSVAVQDHARRAYRLWRQDPSHPSLHFKRVSKAEPIYLIRLRVIVSPGSGLGCTMSMSGYWVGSGEGGYWAPIRV